MGFNREFSLLFLLQMFEIEFRDPEKYLRDLEGPKKTLLSSQPIDPAADLLLNRGISIVETVRLPLRSLTFGKRASIEIRRTRHPNGRLILYNPTFIPQNSEPRHSCRFSL